MAYQDDIELIDQLVGGYVDDLVALMLDARSRSLRKSVFRRRLLDLAETNLRQAYYIAGGGRTGVAELDRLVKAHAPSANKVATDIFSGRYDVTDGGLDEEASVARLKNRSRLWGKSKLRAYNDGVVFRDGADQMLQWRHRQAVELHDSCVTCTQLDTVILATSEWRALRAKGVYPQSRALACNGYNCDCYLAAVESEFSDGLPQVKVRLRL